MLCRAEEEEEMEEEIMAKDDKQVDINSTRNSPLLDIPFDVLKMITELCVGVEYLNFRATCKRCQLSAPVIPRSNETSLRRLQTYSLPSPWLMVFDRHRGMITFTDPMFGDKYFIKTPQELIGDVRIRYSRYGWLVVYNLSHERMSLMLFNPFTNDIRKLPPMGYKRSICFSEPPTSADCMIVGFIPENEIGFHLYFKNHNIVKVIGLLDFDEIVPLSISSDGRDVYALEAGGRLGVYRIKEEGRSFWEVVAEAPRGLCMEAKTPEMENKIFFPRLHSKNGKIVFYSLETCITRLMAERSRKTVLEIS